MEVIWVQLTRKVNGVRSYLTVPMHRDIFKSSSLFYLSLKHVYAGWQYYKKTKPPADWTGQLWT